MNILLFIICICVIGWIGYQFFKGLIHDDPNCGWRKLLEEEEEKEEEEEVESLRDYTDKYK